MCNKTLLFDKALLFDGGILAERTCVSRKYSLTGDFTGRRLLPHKGFYDVRRRGDKKVSDGFVMVFSAASCLIEKCYRRG